MQPYEIRNGQCALVLVRGDITKIVADAIVNAANSALAGGGGVDGAIHAAGGPTLMKELRQYDGCPTGSAVSTGAGLLPAKYVFHAVGPVYRGGAYGEAESLASCYRTALTLAQERGCQSVSFPSISTGIYGYPISDAAVVALDAIVASLPKCPSVTRVNLVQFNDAGFAAYRPLMDHYADGQATAQTS